MPPTKLQMGWTGVQHGTTPITNVMDVAITIDATLQPHSADNSRYPTAVVNSMNGVSANVTSRDTAVLVGLAGGQVGTFTATHKDAKLASGGDIVYTCINMVTGQTATSGAHAEYGTAQLTMMAYSSDGVTSPLSFTRS